MRFKMYKQFKTYYIRCRVCGEGKPKSDFEGAWRVCEACKKKGSSAKKRTYSALAKLDE